MPRPGPAVMRRPALIHSELPGSFSFGPERGPTGSERAHTRVEAGWLHAKSRQLSIVDRLRAEPSPENSDSTRLPARASKLWREVLVLRRTHSSQIVR